MGGFCDRLAILGLALMVVAGGCTSTNAPIRRDRYGTTADGQAVDRYTLWNNSGAMVRIITYGAIVTELHMPDRYGQFGDVVLGFDNLRQYEIESPYFGCAPGRVANRIAGGIFTLDGRQYRLATNNGPNHLHGGVVGIDKRVWQAQPFSSDDGPALRLRYFSPDGEEGYPGNLGITMTYTLTHDNDLKIEYEAETDQPTPVNLTHHGYFNLAGQGAGDVLGHLLHLYAGRYTPTDEQLIPTGKIVSVAGEPVDFTMPTAIGKRIGEMTIAGGYDLNYAIDGGGRPNTLAATVYDPFSGRYMQVVTDQPGIQLYTGNFLNGTLVGKGGAVYEKHAGFCLEAQHFPDAVNQPEFVSIILQPGEVYRQTTVYRFAAEKLGR